MVCFSSEPIEPRQVYDLIEKDAAGSALFHFAVAKALGTTHGMTTHISYEPNGDVEQALNAIAMEMRQKWNLADVLLLRRHGLVAVGEIISLVAVRSPGSGEAFAACRHGLAYMKRMTKRGQNHLAQNFKDYE